MKSILAPTDFSNCSINAVHYAADLAKQMNAKIILFHAFHPPVMVSEIPDMYSITELKQIQLDTLNQLAAELKVKHGTNFKIECICESGFAVEEIQIFQEQNEIELIVMGMKSVGQFTERIIGSLTTTLMYKSSCPILSIPENYKFKPIKKIVLATDFKDPNPPIIFLSLVNLIEVFGAHLYILNVAKNVVEMIETKNTVTEEKYRTAFQTIPHSTHYLKNDEVIEGINHFVTIEKMDLVVMLPKKHSFWDKILNEPNTKKIAFHANVPVLALNVNN